MPRKLSPAEQGSGWNTAEHDAQWIDTSTGLSTRTNRRGVSHWEGGRDSLPGHSRTNDGRGTKEERRRTEVRIPAEQGLGRHRVHLSRDLYSGPIWRGRRCMEGQGYRPVGRQWNSDSL